MVVKLIIYLKIKVDFNVILYLKINFKGIKIYMLKCKIKSL